MITIYENEKFAEYWNERTSDKGGAYTRYVTDPIMFKLIGSLKNKTILELGCGNGYLAKKFIGENAQKVILMDISNYNLNFAKQICNDKRLEFLKHNATKNWNIKSYAIDIIYSNMMLNEVKNIKTPINEAFRVLKGNGQFVFSVTHPAWDLFVFAQEKAGIKSNKIKNLKNYFSRGYAKYIVGRDSKTNPKLSKKICQEFEIQHFHRPISDYFNELVDAGFKINRILEPELTSAILKYSPRFKDYEDHPISLIFYCSK